MAVGIISQLIMLLWEFIRKLLYVWLFMFIPYMIMAHFFPLIKLHQDTTIIYLFVMLSTICGSFSNTTIFAMGDRDYLMIRVMLVSPYMNFLGMLCILTVCSRPIGEMFAIIAFDHFRGIYENRSVLNGTIMAICVLLAYGLPVLNRSVSATWIYAIHPFVIVIMLVLGAGAMYFLWWYKYYRVIIREAMHNKREF